MNLQEAINIVCALPAEKQARNSTQVGLQIVQLEEWENTTFLSDEEVLTGLKDHGRGREGLRLMLSKYRQHYPDAVSYSVIDGSGEVCYGMRFGFGGEDYISF